MKQPLNEKFGDVEQRRLSQQRRFYAKQPKPIGKVIAQLVQRRGFAQVRTADQRDTVWRTLIGDMASDTQLGSLRRGVLEIIVSNSLLMQELTFRKEELLTGLQEALPEAKVEQLRFRVGKVH